MPELRRHHQCGEPQFSSGWIDSSDALNASCHEGIRRAAEWDRPWMISSVPTQAIGLGVTLAWLTSRG